MISLKIPNTLNFSKNFIVNFTFFFLPLLLFDWGLDGLQIGVLMSTFTIVSLFSSFPIGVINDRFSIKHVMSIGLLLEAGFFFGLYSLNGFWAVLPFFLAGGLGGNMIDTSIRSLTFKALGDEKKGRKLGIYQLASSGGFGAGVILGGLLLFSLKFGGVLLLSSLAFLALAALSILISESEMHSIPLGQYRSIILRRKTAIFLLPLFLFGTHWGAEHTSYSLFLREELGIGFIQSGIYIGIPIIILGIFSLAGGMLIDRKGHHRAVFFSGLLLSGIGHILMVNPSVQLSFLFRVMHETGDAFAAVGYNFIFSRIFRTESVSGETGAAYSVMTLGAVTGSLVFGPLGYAYGFGWPLIASGMITLLSLGILIMARKFVNL